MDGTHFDPAISRIEVHVSIVSIFCICTILSLNSHLIIYCTNTWCIVVADGIRDGTVCLQGRDPWKTSSLSRSLSSSSLSSCEHALVASSSLFSVCSFLLFSSAALASARANSRAYFFAGALNLWYTLANISGFSLRSNAQTVLDCILTTRRMAFIFAALRSSLSSGMLHFSKPRLDFDLFAHLSTLSVNVVGTSSMLSTMEQD